MKFFKKKDTTIEDTTLFYIQRVVFLMGSKKAYKFTNVSPSLAKKLKKEFIGDYLKESQTFFLDFNKNKEVVVIDCTLGNLERLITKLLKGED